MSNAVSALNGQEAKGDVTVRELGLTGMITLRGDFEDENFGAALSQITGAGVPDVRQFVQAGENTVLWMSPDELLVILPYEKAAETVAAFDAALKGSHFLAVNVSDARTLISISGDYANEVLAKLSPVDMAADQFTAGMVRRTRLAQVAAAFWMLPDGSYNLMCFRSVADYAFGLLKTSAKGGAVAAL